MCHSFVTSWTPFFVWRIFSLYIPWEYLLSLLKVQMPDPNFSGFLRTIENFKIHKSREKSTTFPLLPFNHLQQWALTPQFHPRLSVLPLFPLHPPLLPVLQPPSHPYSSSSMVSKLPLLPDPYFTFVLLACKGIFQSKGKAKCSTSVSLPTWMKHILAGSYNLQMRWINCCRWSWWRREKWEDGGWTKNMELHTREIDFVKHRWW